MKIEIKNLYDDIIVSGDYRDVREACEKNKDKLEGVELSGVDLSDANLSDANLSDANLSDADLSDACLHVAYVIKDGKKVYFNVEV